MDRLVHRPVGRHYSCTWVVSKKGRWGAVCCVTHGTPQNSSEPVLPPAAPRAPLLPHMSKQERRIYTGDLSTGSIVLNVCGLCLMISELCLRVTYITLVGTVGFYVAAHKQAANEAVAFQCVDSWCKGQNGSLLGWGELHLGKIVDEEVEFCGHAAQTGLYQPGKIGKYKLDSGKYIWNSAACMLYFVRSTSKDLQTQNVC